MIIVDDGSTDATSQKIAEYSDERLRYVRQEHRGKSKLGATYNHALSLSKGEIIAILEGDDFWSADKLERQVAVFEDPSVVLSFSNYYIAYDSGESLKCVLPEVTQLYPSLNNNPLGNALYPLFEGISPGSLTLMFRKTTLLEIGGFQQLFDLPYVDYPTILAMTLKGHFAYVPETLGYFRRHKGSISSSSLDNQTFLTEIKNEKHKYCRDFLRQNANKIIEFGLSVDELEKANETRRRNELHIMYIISGRELFEMGDHTGSRKAYGQLLKYNAPLLYKLVAFIAILLTYCGMEVRNIIICYTRLQKLRLRCHHIFRGR